MDVYLSLQGNRMNMVMKRLTALSTILMSAALISGIYGMNFQHMPELTWTYGYYAALGAMIVIVLGLVVFFRWIKWL
jgi:magnesium transporter